MCGPGVFGLIRNKSLICMTSFFKKANFEIGAQYALPELWNVFFRVRPSSSCVWRGKCSRHSRGDARWRQRREATWRHGSSLKSRVSENKNTPSSWTVKVKRKFREHFLDSYRNLRRWCIVENAYLLTTDLCIKYCKVIEMRLRSDSNNCLHI